VTSPDSVNYQITSYTVRGADMKIVALTILPFAHLFPSPQLVAQQSAGSSSPSSDMPKIGQVPPPEWSQCGVSPPETQLKGLPGKVT
jgi:hypothetical protein